MISQLQGNSGNTIALQRSPLSCRIRHRLLSSLQECVSLLRSLLLARMSWEPATSTEHPPPSRNKQPTRILGTASLGSWAEEAPCAGRLETDPGTSAGLSHFGERGVSVGDWGLASSWQYLQGHSPAPQVPAPALSSAAPLLSLALALEWEAGWGSLLRGFLASPVPGWLLHATPRLLLIVVVNWISGLPYAEDSGLRGIYSKENTLLTPNSVPGQTLGSWDTVQREVWAKTTCLGCGGSYPTGKGCWGHRIIES